MVRVAFASVASVFTHAMGSVGKFGWITQMTKKCLCLATGVTTVHLVNSSFLGFKGFMA